MGESFMIIWVRYIIAWKRDSKKLDNNCLFSPGNLVIAIPIKIVKKITLNISPFAAADIGFSGIILMKISRVESGVFKFS